MKLACVAAGKDFNRLKGSVNGDEITVFKKMEGNGRTLYFTALHFEGLNQTRYGAL